jgi:transcription-repair coupling factor (superfamily II helicase)
VSNSAPALQNQSTGENSAPALALKDLPSLLLGDEDFGSVVQALRQGRSATVDGAWGSSAALAAATLAGQAPTTSVVVLAHPRDVDGWVSDLVSFSGVRPVIFPAWDSRPTTHLDEVAGARLRVLRQMEVERPRLVLTTIQALMQPVPDRRKLAQDRRVLRRGDVVDLEELATWLVEHGYQPGEVVELAGEFGRRGGIVDVFSPDADYPSRIEFFGDEVESIRHFDPQTQRSLGLVDAIELMGIGAPPEADGSPDGGLPMTGHLCEYLPPDAWTILVEPEDLSEQGNHYLERTEDQRGLFTVQGRLRAIAPLCQRQGLATAQPDGRGHLPPARRVDRAVQR